MSYSASPLLKTAVIDPGTEDNTWGIVANNYIFSRLEQAITGAIGITLSGPSYTLDDAAFSGTESHQAVLVVAGAPGTDAGITVPRRSKLYVIYNTLTSYSIVITTGAGGTNLTIPPTGHAYVYVDGVNVNAIYDSFQPIPSVGHAAYHFLASDGAHWTLYSPVTVRSTLGMAANTQWVNAADLSSDATAYIFNMLYPMGSIFMNVSNVNPGTYGFGAWTPLGQGRVLIGAGTGTDARGASVVFAPGAAGGEYAHVLTEAEMPPHNHGVREYSGVTGGAPGISSGTGGTAGAGTGYTGGGQPHNNLPPYLAVYMWYRSG